MRKESKQRVCDLLKEKKKRGNIIQLGVSDENTELRPSVAEGGSAYPRNKNERNGIMGLESV